MESRYVDYIPTYFRSRPTIYILFSIRSIGVPLVGSQNSRLRQMMRQMWTYLITSSLGIINFL